MKKLINKDGVVFIIFSVLVIFLLHSLGQGRLGTFLITPLGYLYYVGANPLKIKNLTFYKAFFWYFALFLLASFSTFYSIDVDAAINTQKKMFIVFLFTAAVFSFSLKSIIFIRYVYVSNVIILFLLIIYVQRVGLDIYNTDRIEDSIFNANTYGYYIFTGLFSLFFLYGTSQNKKSKLIISLLILIATVFSFWMTLASASRGAAIILGLIVVGNFFIVSSIGRKGLLKKIILLSIFFVVLIKLGDYISSKYLEGSFLVERFENLDERETPREFHFRKAIEIGSSNPFFGVGAGNYAIIPKNVEQGSFTHNTFLEIFANLGIFGLIIYLFLIKPFFSLIFKSISGENSIIHYQFLLFIFVFLIYSTLYVVYLSNIFMHFLFTIYAHLLTLSSRSNLHKNYFINR